MAVTFKTRIVEAASSLHAFPFSALAANLDLLRLVFLVQAAGNLLHLPNDFALSDIFGLVIIRSIYRHNARRRARRDRAGACFAAAVGETANHGVGLLGTRHLS